jgi:RHS repeat-associated protein
VLRAGRQPSGGCDADCKSKVQKPKSEIPAQAGAGPALALRSDGANRITNLGYVYDAAGNLLMDNVNCYSYDAENRLAAVAPETSPGSDVCGAVTMSYLYDPAGHRVAKLQNGAIVKEFYYDTAGQEIAETNGSGALQRAEIFAGGRHLATWTNNATYFNYADWLGTERVRTNSSGTVCQTITSLPFGDGEATSGNCSPTPNFFTGKERDSESNLDYFGARYFSSNLARFVTPDWAAKPTTVPYAEFGDPQSLNLYQYMRDNPLGGVDADGHCWPPSACAEALMAAVNHAQSWVQNEATASGHSSLAAAATFESGVARDMINGVASLGTVGRASGALIDSGTTTQKIVAASEDLGKAGGIALIGAGIAGGLTSSTSATTTVTHFTDDATAQAITDSGGVLYRGTYVTTPGEVPAGATSTQVERLLEIGPGKGQNSITFDTPNSNLMSPENGPTTSGGARQFRLKGPTRIDPWKFKKTDGQ